MIKLKDLLKEELTDADIKVGDAYYRKTHVGYVVSFVYDKSIYGGLTTIEYQFKPQYGEPGFMGVGDGSALGVDGYGKWPKVKVTSKMKALGKFIMGAFEPLVKLPQKAVARLSTLGKFIGGGFIKTAAKGCLPLLFAFAASKFTLRSASQACLSFIS